MMREPSQGSSEGRRKGKRGTGHQTWRALWRIVGCLALAAPTGVQAQSLETLRHLSIEQLADVQVTSVFKRPASLSQTPAAVYVITSDDIRRSGATSLPEALRLAPNLEVARVNAQSYVISARGFNSVNASNKLLVMIDGRSIYTPFFDSVFWDQQQVMLADIDRIEVISGPGGTLWGANAVNGVINIITKNSRDTQGGLLDLTYGNRDKSGAGRWGGKLGDIGTYRGYALGFGRGNTDLPSGTSAQDDWNGKQAGFRSDLAALGGSLTLSGDAYENLIDTPGGRRNGGNFSGSWTRPLGNGSSVQVLAYYDRQDRSDPGTSDQVNTLDLEAQHTFPLGTNHQLVWGFGQRVWSDRFVNTANAFVLIPGNQTIALTDLFGQDTISLGERLKLTVGTKLEYSSFTGLDVLPSGRLGWQANPSNFLWLAVSRAVRTPSRIDRDLQAPGIVAPAPEFRSEKLAAYEAGYRAVPWSSLSLSLSLFFNQYDDLRTTSLSSSGGFPVTFENGLAGDTWGGELWADWKVLRWWRLSPGVDLLRKDLHLKPGATDIAGIQTSAGHDPGHQLFLRSYMDLPHNLELFVGLRQIGALSDVGVPSYFEVNARLGWRLTPGLELSIAGENLVHAHHVETVSPTALEIPRSVYASLRWGF